MGVVRAKRCATIMQLLFACVLLNTGALVPAHATQQKVGACSLPIVVRATLLAEGAPRWSTAMIYHVKSAYSKSYTINPGSNQLAVGVTIKEIQKLAVLVDNKGELERCTGEAHRFTKISSTQAVKPRSRVEPAVIGAANLPDKLKDIFELFADAEKASTAGVGGAAREGTQAAWTDKFVVPGVSGGPHSPRAFQVGRLQKDSIYYKLGIRNFDVGRSVNGMAFESPEKALELAEKLGNTLTLTIQVQRRGKPMNIDLNLK